MTMIKNHQPKISVIIPVFNEPKILDNIKIIKETLSKSFSNYEIICVEDGQNQQVPKKFRRYHSKKIKVISYPFNIGKGFALSYGFSQSKGQLVAFLDGDLDLHPKQLRLFVDLMDLVDADIIIGSKCHPLSRVKYPFIRKVYSKIYQMYVKLLFGLDLSDTQVGIKLFKRKVLDDVIPRLAIKAWAFDLEVLVVANHLGYKRIIEAPVEIKMRQFGSKVNLYTVLNIIKDTTAIFYRLNALDYYSKKGGSLSHKFRLQK